MGKSTCRKKSSSVRKKSGHAHDLHPAARRIDVLLEMAEEERLRREDSSRPAPVVLGPNGGVHQCHYKPTTSRSWQQCKCGRYRRVGPDE